MNKPEAVVSDEWDEYGFCGMCGREVGAQEWDGECTGCEEFVFPCANDQCEEMVYVEGELCLRCDKILADMMIETKMEVQNGAESDLC